MPKNNPPLPFANAVDLAVGDTNHDLLAQRLFNRTGPIAQSALAIDLGSNGMLREAKQLNSEVFLTTVALDCQPFGLTGKLVPIGRPWPPGTLHSTHSSAVN